MFWMFREDGALVMLDPFTRILADIPATAPWLMRTTKRDAE